VQTASRNPDWYANVMYGVVAVGLVSITVVFYWSPQTVDQVIDGIMRRLSPPPAVVVTPAPEENRFEQPVVQKPAKPRHAVVKAKPPEGDTSYSVVRAKPEEAPRVQPQAQPDSTEASVKIDDAAVYSANSPRSSVVNVLKKGDKVESTLEVIDSRGRWSLVRTNGANAGFVRSEDLQRLQANPDH